MPKGMPQKMEIRGERVVGREVQLKASWPTGSNVSCEISVWGVVGREREQGVGFGRDGVLEMVERG